jgi:peptidoglycan/xylan/chitin deacetylase (PgdA/CDA1 family)
MADAPKILETDSLRNAFPKLNNAIDNANEALSTSNTAESNSLQAINSANEANDKADDTQTQLNTIIIESGTSDAEVLQARGEFPVLNERLGNVDAELDNKAKKDIPFANSLPGATRFRKGERKKVLTHYNGTLKSTSAGVTVTQTSAREMKVTTPGAAAYTVILGTTRVVPSFNEQYIDVVVEARDWSLINLITLKITPDAAVPGNYYSRNIIQSTDKPLPNNKPSLVRLHKELFTPTGTPTGLTIGANSEIAFTISTTQATTLKFWNGIVATTPMIPYMIMFDDGDKGVYDFAFPAMKERGIVGTFFVNSDRIGDSISVTWDQLKEMQEAGWTIANHTSNHIDLVASTLENAMTAVEKGAGDLAEKGFRGANYLAAPYNAMDSSRHFHLSHAVQSFRIGMATSGTNSQGNYLHKKPFPAYIRGYSVINTDTPTGLYNTNYLTAKGKGLMYCFVFHNLVDVGLADTQYEYPIDKFEQFLDLLIADNVVFTNMEEFSAAYLVTEEDIPNVLNY